MPKPAFESPKLPCQLEGDCGAPGNLLSLLQTDVRTVREAACPNGGESYPVGIYRNEKIP